ncbi:MAG: multicopper oxidase domain-containing protein [Alphaproteobacteria bacterium]|nr:multicopper oxidase domain-containing protein [Alphaproteobacteria bacterium]
MILDPDWTAHFANPLPLPTRIELGKKKILNVDIRQTEQWLGLTDADGAPLTTTVWGYGVNGKVGYPGPTFVATAGEPQVFVWRNQLPLGPHLLPVDTSTHQAMPTQAGMIPTVTHLHGGRVDSASDGLPEAWYTQGFAEVGPAFVSRFQTYSNDQQAGTLWYHDHALGLTRLNVYAGLAGFYILHDKNEVALVKAGVLPGGKYDVEMAIQDRSFTADGQLYIPAYADDPIPGTTETVADTLPEHYHGPYPTVVPEFFGDHILVNGMAWPKFGVEAGEYRMRVLNGSDSRFYVLQTDNPWVKVTMVGSDIGLLPQAVTVMDGDGVQEEGEQLVMAPGERMELVFDFGAVGGQSVVLRNHGPAFDPFKGMDGDALAGGIDSAQGYSVGEIMRFDVAAGPALNNASVEDGTVLDPTYQAILDSDADVVRKLGLFEQTDHHGRIMPMLGVAEESLDAAGNTVFGPLMWDDPTTERPLLGDTEIWEIHNFTEDAHPIHLHLVKFQVLGRHAMSFTDEDEDGVPDDVTGDGAVVAGEDTVIDPNGFVRIEDEGWQDTAWVAPGEVIRIAATFDIAGEYVWHCHVLSHEDNEMMRRFEVVDPMALAA